jgi:hypothetical protein
MGNALVVINFRDNGGRRSGLERRRFSYDGYIPERRLGAERRSGTDRRAGLERRAGCERRDGSKEASVADLQEFKDRRVLENRRAGMDRRDFMFA